MLERNADQGTYNLTYIYIYIFTHKLLLMYRGADDLTKSLNAEFVSFIIIILHQYL